MYWSIYFSANILFSFVKYFVNLFQLIFKISMFFKIFKIYLLFLLMTPWSLVKVFVNSLSSVKYFVNLFQLIFWISMFFKIFKIYLLFLLMTAWSLVKFSPIFLKIFAIAILKSIYNNPDLGLVCFWLHCLIGNDWSLDIFHGISAISH